MKKYLVHQGDQGIKFWQIETKGLSFVITQGGVGTIGRETIKKFKGRNECLRQAEKRIYLRLQKGYNECSPLSVQKTTLPLSIKKALSYKRTFHTPEGKFTRHALRDVRSVCIAVRVLLDALNKDPDYYLTTACVLADNSSFHPADEQFIVWLPAIKLFGKWIRKSNQLIVFPGKSWGEIENSFSTFIQETDAFPSVCSYINVHECFDFLASKTTEEVERIIALPDHGMRMNKTQAFIKKHEHTLYNHPYNEDLNDHYSAVITAYCRMGEWMNGDKNYAMAARYFEKCTEILNQSPVLAKKFSDVYIQLGFCYVELARFDQAIQCINIYQRHHVDLWDGCNQIKASIFQVQKLYKETLTSYLKNVESSSNHGVKEVNRIITQAIQARPDNAVFHFIVAGFYSSSKNVNKALHHFEEALKNGFRSRDRIHLEPALNRIRATKRFEAVRLKYL